MRGTLVQCCWVFLKAGKSMWSSGVVFFFLSKPFYMALVVLFFLSYEQVILKLWKVDFTMLLKYLLKLISGLLVVDYFAGGFDVPGIKTSSEKTEPPTECCQATSSPRMQNVLPGTFQIVEQSCFQVFYFLWILCSFHFQCLLVLTQH